MTGLSSDAGLSDASASAVAASAGDAAYAQQLGDGFVSLHALFARLRRECPWDREQTHASLVPHLQSETRELSEALVSAHEALAGSDVNEAATAVEDMVQELGDVLLQVMLHSAIGEQAGTFTLVDVVCGVEEKMVRRHPHVFERSAEDPEPTEADLSAQWKRIKAAERAERSRRIAERVRRSR